LFTTIICATIAALTGQQTTPVAGKLLRRALVQFAIGTAAHGSTQREFT